MPGCFRHRRGLRPRVGGSPPARGAIGTDTGMTGRQRLIEHLRENGVVPIPVGHTKHCPSLRSLARSLRSVGGGAPPSRRHAHTDLPTPSILPMQNLPEWKQGPAGDWNG